MYTPASNLTTTSTISHLATVYYKKRALSNLKKKFIFSEACTMDALPRQSGKTIQWFRYLPSAVVPTNIVAKDAAEGSVGTGIGMTTTTVSATISQYTDFASVSDLLKDTAIDPIVEGMSDMLSYRASYIADTVTRNEIDSAASTASVTLLGTYYRAADARNVRHQLQGLDIQPMDSGIAKGQFLGVIHPYVSYDLVNDPAAGGLLDIYKFTDPSAFVKNEDRGAVATVGGVKFFENTNVKQTAGSPNKWRVYIFGKDGVGIADLEGKGPSRLSDPSKQRFSLNVIPGHADIADPEGIIGAIVSYNFKFAAKILDSPALSGQYRFRYADAPSSIVG